MNFFDKLKRFGGDVSAQIGAQMKGLEIIQVNGRSFRVHSLLAEGHRSINIIYKSPITLFELCYTQIGGLCF